MISTSFVSMVILLVFLIYSGSIVCLGGDLHQEYVSFNDNIISFYSKSLDGFQSRDQEAMFYFQMSLIFFDR